MFEKIRDNKWLTLLIISIGFFIILIDTTVVNVSIPSMIKDLHASLADVEWIISGYALSFAALLITFGRLGDMYGQKRLFIIGLVVFGVASFFSGESANATILIFARLAQGIGGAMISPSVLSLISANFKGKQRALAFGIFGAITGVAVAVGPILGGFFTTYYSWRWVFRINIPICIIGIIVSSLFVREVRMAAKEKLDALGMLLSTLGCFLLVFALIEGQNYGWLTPNKQFHIGSFIWTNTQVSIIVVAIMLSLASLILFVIIERYKTNTNDQPAFDLSFLQYNTFKFGLIAIAVIALGEFSSLFTLPIFLQGIRGLTALQSGLATLPLAAASFIAAPLSARIVNRIGSKWVITTGISLEFLGLLLLSRLAVDTTVVQLIVPLAILGAGIGLAISQNTQVILSDIPLKGTGSASGVLNTIRQVGSALGIAIVGAILSSQISTNIATQVNTVQNIPQYIRNGIIASANNNQAFEEASSTPTYAPPPSPQIMQNPQALAAYKAQAAKLEADIRQAVDVALTDSISTSIRFGSIFLFLGAVLSLFIPNVKQKEES